MASKYRRRRTTRKAPSRFKRRRSTRISRVPRRTFRGRTKRGGHKRMSSRVLGGVLPDIGVTKMKWSYTRVNVSCIDLDTSLYLGVTPLSNNTISVRMNGNPKGGTFLATPGSANFTVAGNFFPVTTWTTKYSRYRPMGAKVSIKVWSQDEGNVGASENQVATPFTLFGFPCILDSTTTDSYANQWTGIATGYTCNTVQSMKYGFSRTSPGLGGKNMVKYSTYWDFAKIMGFTREQYLANDAFACQPDSSTTAPALPVVLVLGLADYAGAVIRKCTVETKITQYGRWEGQLLDLD